MAAAVLDALAAVLLGAAAALALALWHGFDVHPTNALVLHAMGFVALAAAGAVARARGLAAGGLALVGVYLALFAAVELAFFAGAAELTSRAERVASAYQWFDVYLSPRAKLNLTEGYFGGRWGLAPEAALARKYELAYGLLGLRPGMAVLDVGCGYCGWLAYLARRGVRGVGLTLSPQQAAACAPHTALVRDVMAEGGADGLPAVDAVTMFGSLEHFVNCRQTRAQQSRAYEALFRRCAALLRPGGRVFVSAIHLTPGYPRSPGYYAHCYLLERHYSGMYPEAGQVAAAAAAAGLAPAARIDTTEDYRWTSVRDPEHFGAFRARLDSPRRACYAAFMFLTDPYAAAKWLYHACGSWMWQFGGASRAPGLADRQATPFRAAFEVFEKVGGAP
jgi:cyclopropane fatty-acyl-phospholipid synthase-like methyltransferase